MKNATYTVTSETFHGTIFSIIFNKQFVAMSHGRFKTKELLERTNMKYRDCLSADEIISKLEEKAKNF